jgi:hypothetical protein
VVDRSQAGGFLALAGSTALLLRARLFPVPQQRIPLLVGGITGLGVLALSITFSGSRLPVLFVLVLAAGAVLAAGLVYSRRTPTPYLGRIADIVDVLSIMALIPLACAVIGVFSLIQGKFAEIGG